MIISPLLSRTYCIFCRTRCNNVCVCVCVCVRACVYVQQQCADARPLRTHGPLIRFSRLRAVTGSKPCGPQTALPSFPITKNSSGFTLCVSLFLHTRAHTHTHTHTHTHIHSGTHPHSPLLPLFLSEMSRSSHSAEFSHRCNSYFPCCLPPPPPIPHTRSGPLRIT